MLIESGFAQIPTFLGKNQISSNPKKTRFRDSDSTKECVGNRIPDPSGVDRLAIAFNSGLVLIM
jgi:hypothetical protein